MDAVPPPALGDLSTGVPSDPVWVMSAGDRGPHAPSSALLRSAQLLLPADGEDAEVVVCHNFDAIAPHADVCVYVCPPADDGGFSALSLSAARERFLVHTRNSPPPGYHVAGAHRIAPSVAGSRGAVGRSVRAGLLIELHRDTNGETNVRRVLDEVLSETGAKPPTRFTSSGGVLADYGPGYLLRVTTDPSPSTDALQALAGYPMVPKLVAWGHTAGAFWSVESKLGGKRPRHMTPAIAKDLVTFCASFPVLNEPPAAPLADLSELAFLLAGRTTLWTKIGRRLQELLPDVSVPRHGDMWTSNLLVSHGRLCGIVDWDAWFEHSTPGTDLLHALAFDPSTPIGRSVLRRPWDDHDVRTTMTPYWQTLGVPMTSDAFEVAGLSWWLGCLATAVAREPNLAADEHWMYENVDAAAAAFV